MKMVHMANLNSPQKCDNGVNYNVFSIGGGSLVDRRPVFSPNIEQLFIPQKNVVLSFSIKTGEFIRKFEGLNDNIIVSKIHPLREELLLAASESGEIIGWRWKTATQILSLTLDVSQEAKALTDLHFLPLSNDDFNVYASCITESNEARVSSYTSHGQFITTHLIYKKKAGKLFFDLGCYDSGHFLCAASRNRLDVYDITRGVTLNLKSTHLVPTCLKCHPRQAIVAVGDDRGRILVWSDVVHSDSPARSVYHWHTLQVRDVIFTREGSGLYSGGDESVLVQWRLNSPIDRSFLPRLPGKILHLAVSPHNELMAVSTADNAIVVIDSLKNTRCQIQNFSKGVLVEALQQAPFPAGLKLDPRSRSLVLNGRTGFIQFFDPKNQRLLYNVDITGQNNLCQERNAVTKNTEVTQIALSSDGAWLATAEFNSTGEVSFQVTLKFWRFDPSEKTYSLSMSTDMPHEGAINALLFRPTPALVDTANLAGLMAVTTAKDNKFRVWELFERQVISIKKLSWLNSNVAQYRDLAAGDATFSSDGSILGVAFGPCLTLWDPEECVLKTSLTHPTERSHIRCARFGTDDCCHLVVSVSDVTMAVWNVLSLTISWSVAMKVNVLATDPCSSYMAAVMKRSVFVFKPNSPSPRIIKKSLCKKDSSILAAAFVPRGEVKSDSEEGLNSHLYFLSSDQLLLSMVHRDDSKSEELASMPEWTEDAATPFTLYKAEWAKSDVKAAEGDHSQLGSAGAKELMELLRLPTHSMPPVELFCGAFLRSLVVQTTQTSAGDGAADEAVEADEAVDEADDDQVKGVRTDSEGDGNEASVKPRKASGAAPQAAPAQDAERRLRAVARDKMKWAAALIT